MTTQIWISTVNIPTKSKLLEPEWQHGGDLNEQRESDLWKIVQGYLGLRRSSQRRTVDFYADLDPHSAGYQELLAAQPAAVQPAAVHSNALTDPNFQFWLALRWSGPPERILFSSEHAQLAPMQVRRPPEPLPGLLMRPVVVGMRLRADRGSFFDAG